MLVIRDQDLLNPDAAPSKSEPVVPKIQIDRDGDAANNGTGFGKPAEGPVRQLRTRALSGLPAGPAFDEAGRAAALARAQRLRDHLSESGGAVRPRAAAARPRRHRWRAAAIWRQPVAAGATGSITSACRRAARAEFIVDGPPRGRAGALLVTRTVDTGPGRRERSQPRAGRDHRRWLTRREPQAALPANAAPLPTPARPWLGDVAPVRVRKLYFSENWRTRTIPTAPANFI